MNRVRFEGFSAGLFQFLSELAANNNKEWFDENRRVYETQTLAPIKAFVAELGPILGILNEEFETEARVGRTITRINNDMRFHKDRPPYRPLIYIVFPRRGRKWSDEALLYGAISAHGVSIGFYPGGYKQPRIGPVQQGIKKNLRLFQRYLDERRIAETYWELADGEDARLKRWPLPKTARRWMNLDSFTVGEFFAANDPILSRRRFLDRAQKILLDLYPLWLFATSENLKNDLELYGENIESLGRPLTKAAGRR
jgi:uncharacterized protein (TIGR02453 family)